MTTQAKRPRDNLVLRAERMAGHVSGQKTVLKLTHQSPGQYPSIIPIRAGRHDVLADVRLGHVKGYWRYCNIGLQRVYPTAEYPEGPRSSDKLYLPFKTAEVLAALYKQGELNPIASINLGYFPNSSKGKRARYRSSFTFTQLDIPAKSESLVHLALKMGLSNMGNNDAIVISEGHQALLVRFVSDDDPMETRNCFFHNGVFTVFGTEERFAIIPSLFTAGDLKELTFRERASMLLDVINSIYVRDKMTYIIENTEGGVKHED